MFDGQRIDPVLVDIALKALHPAGVSTNRPIQRERMERALRAVDDARGLKEERSVVVGHYSLERVTLEDGEIPDPHGGLAHGQQEVRLTSDWRPVEQGDADGD